MGLGIGLLGFQTTIASSVTLTGIGVHSGAGVTMVFHPAEADSGIVFQRLADDNVIAEYKAVSSNVGNTDLCTVLGVSPATSIATIEHVMAALYALGIDNLLIEVHGAEIPVMDGSSTVFIDAIETVGIKALAVKKRYIKILKPVRIEAGASWSEFVPHDAMRFEVEIDFDCPLIGRQSWKGDISPSVFKAELSRARTFGFMRDVERMWAAGRGLGSSLENSVVIADDNTVINVEGLRYKDEFARHKTLDAIGDLALAGMPFLGCYRSYRGGHKMNSYALKALLSDHSAYEIVEGAGSRQRSAVREMNAAGGPEVAPWSA